MIKKFYNFSKRHDRKLMREILQLIIKLLKNQMSRKCLQQIRMKYEGPMGLFFIHFCNRAYARDIWINYKIIKRSDQISRNCLHLIRMQYETFFFFHPFL